ncbi:hypothetical protein M409DRAFT_53058 [Zasmidium cellare ATCC 36951]|uniref:Major facilitator superfamily (MFS) profile domain-containing protein n=1 Tax=Zasmidium cellare ATCC 36951 TaxID=1080233 RepID=A0A6A6CQ67_ZASCE|nr:uncharacterized protein M409DRAFT_53058 [Zasmidium cellare ATCC 36951]KAF2168368.1 hypothetical protein M409DRAFT_53058 [Zasmidium cellare ATCC 36951]
MDTSSKEEKAVTATLKDSEHGEQEIYIDPELEKRTLRKFDRWVLPQFMLLVLIAYLDRSNIGNARVFGFEEGLGLTGHQFNDISTVFYATYVLFEVPWVMAVKRFGANTVLAAALVSWSIVTLCTGFIHNYTQCIVMRLLLGAAEAGLFPALSFIISTIWDRKSQAKRVSLLYMSSALSGAFGGLIAYGIQTMGRQRGLDAWRWLFIIEGAISIFICLLAWFSLPKSAEEAWFLTAEERGVMQARKAREALYKGTDEFSWKFVKQAVTDPFIYASAALLFCSSIPLFGFGTFLPTIIQGLGYTGLAPNYLSIPCYVLAAITLISWTTLSDRLGKRALFAFLAPIPCIIGYAIVVRTPSPEAGYAAMFLCAAGIYPYNAIMFTWLLNNLSPDWKRSVGAPLFASLANISGVISSQIYPSSDSPRYLMGNAVSLAMEAVACGGVLFVWLLLKRRDQKKERMLAEGDIDNGYGGEDRGLQFRYAL